MKILFVASEMAPFAKVGGIADVIRSLPRRIAALGLDVRVVIPYYRSVKSNLSRLGIKPKDRKERVVLCMDWLPVEGEIKEIQSDGVTVYLLSNDEYYNRRYIYSTHDGDYEDNDMRFGFLSLGALEVAKKVGFEPDIIHCHDWQTALLPICLKWRKHVKDDEFFKNTKTVFTIHNISYQGLYERGLLDKFGLPEFLFTSQGLELYGKANLLKGGIIYSDLVTTVSPTYAEELKKREYAYGLDAVLKWISRDHNNLTGILNGIDYESWNPEKDECIYRNYGVRNLKNKEINKQKLKKELGLDSSEDKPLIGVVSKLDEQRGTDLITESLAQILDLGYQMAIVGAGTSKFENSLRRAMRKYSGSISVTVDVNNDELERKVYAGSDMFLMPSRFEPCGLGQIIALRYGSVPVARGTGGILDTVSDYTEDKENGNGFLFHEFSTVSMLDALIRAISVYENKDEWKHLITKAMREDLSWRSSGKKYTQIYKNLLNNG
ncbi:MAG: glycogen synthase GlgA [Deltaproteobacteria bacterium]